MTSTRIVLLVVAVLLVAAVAAVLLARSRARRRAELRSTFGPEYDRAVAGTGRRDAERELAERAERRRALEIRPLPAGERTAYAERWRSAQADFVDRPSEAVRTADHLVTEVMARRGYPVEDFEQQVRDVSVDHADVVEEYRQAHAICELDDRSQASTEQLRQAMVHYRALFDDLLADSDTSAPVAGATAGGPARAGTGTDARPVVESGEAQGILSGRGTGLDGHDGAVLVAHSDDDHVGGTSRPEPTAVVRVHREVARPLRGVPEGVEVSHSDGGRVQPGGLLRGPADSGPADSGPADSGPADSGPADSGPLDAGPADSGPADSGPADRGPSHLAPADGSVPLEDRPRR